MQLAPRPSLTERLKPRKKQWTPGLTPVPMAFFGVRESAGCMHYSPLTRISFSPLLCCLLPPITSPNLPPCSNLHHDSACFPFLTIPLSACGESTRRPLKLCFLCLNCALGGIEMEWCCWQIYGFGSWGHSFLDAWYCDDQDGMCWRAFSGGKLGSRNRLIETA